MLSPAVCFYRFNSASSDVLISHLLECSARVQVHRMRMRAVFWYFWRRVRGLLVQVNLARRASSSCSQWTPPSLIKSGELYSAWSERFGAITCIPSEKVQQLFNDMQLYPSELEVLEMLQCAQKCARRSSPSHLTVGEFFVFATELKRCSDKGISRPVQLSRLLERDTSEEKRKPREISKGLSSYEYDVFLGGSCNPTTWRQDDAIPLLENLGISFYNPQVANWKPELIEKEHFAKQNAAVLFFVIDNQTRNTATTVEVSFFSGLRRNMILVIQPYVSSRSEIAGEQIFDDELADLKSGQQVMQALAERQGIPVFNKISCAVDGVAKVLWENVSVQELRTNLQSGRNGSTPMSDRLMKLRKAFDAIDKGRTGEISLQDVRTSDLWTAGILEKEIKENVPFENLRVNFDQFCAIFAEVKSSPEEWSMLPVQSLKPELSSKPHSTFDIYLGGSSMGTSWREDVAIPVFKKHGLTYSKPASNQWTGRLLQSNLSAADSSHVILFVITNTARSLAEICMAAYYIGLGYDVVLHVELLAEDSVVNGKKLSKLAVKEYNRGRMYLLDLAKREGVHVFDTISAAVDKAVSKCSK